MKNKLQTGYFGEFGGAYVSEELKRELDRVYEEYLRLKKDKDFRAELAVLRHTYQGRPTPLYYCRKLSEQTGGADIYLKREDLNHTGAHKINHCIGEVLLAKHLGKKTVIGETGAGQHGLALATALCAFRPELPHFYGRNRREKTGHQRPQNAAFGRGGRLRVLGRENAERRRGRGL